MTRHRALLLVLLLLSTRSLPADSETAEKPQTQKPTEQELEEARRWLKNTEPDKFRERFAALDVVQRGGDKSIVPLLFDSAVLNQLGAYAVRAGEVANALDPRAAVQAYDRRVRKLKLLRMANAVRFLGEVRAPGVGARLADRAKGQDPEARVEAMYALVKLGEAKYHPQLVQLLKSPRSEVRIPGAIGCGLARAARAAPILVKGLDEAEDHFAFFCAWALGQLRDKTLLAKVIAATKGRMVGDVGHAKAKAVQECAFDPETHVELLLPLVDSSVALSHAAVEALGRIGEGRPDAADALVRLLLTTRNAKLGSHAADSLGRIGGAEHGERILTRYENNPGRIPSYAVKALGLLKTPRAPKLLSQLMYRAKDFPLRKRACAAFWRCADREARRRFQERLLATSHNRRLQAGCLVLGFDRSADGFEFALKLMRRHYGKKNAGYVRNALERMTGHRFAAEPSIWKKWYERNLDFFDRKPQFLNREEWRKELVASKAEMGISPRTEAAVEGGLEWLARHQSYDGRWSGSKFTDRCQLYYRKKCQIGARFGGWDVGMTGISLLAFYGAGYRPDTGRYKDTVLRGQIYCAARQWADGDFGGQADLIGGYTRPIATIALAEAYGTVQQPEYRERARRSVAHLVRIQYPDAGWRYRLSGQFPGDTSVTGWNAWAIATARKFGIPVDPMGLEGALSLINRFSSVVTQDEEYYNTDPHYFFEVGRGQFFKHYTGYNAQDGTRPPMTALGLICRIFMGARRSHPYCIGAANTLLERVPEYDERTNKIKYVQGAEYPIYYWYYGSLAMYQMGGRFWRKWSRPFLTEGIPNVQVAGDECERGSWDCDILDSLGGRVYTTAMAVLTLETFYRYLPLLTG
jgi:HEAT repeat protein